MMGQQQSHLLLLHKQLQYSECETIDLEIAGEGPLPLYLQCKGELLEQVCKLSPMLQTWDGLLMDTNLRAVVLTGTNMSLWAEMQKLKELLREVIQEATTLAELLEPPMEVFTAERALREKVDLYRFRQTRLLKWVQRHGNPHLKLILKHEIALLI